MTGVDPKRVHWSDLRIRHSQERRHRAAFLLKRPILFTHFFPLKIPLYAVEMPSVPDAIRQDGLAPESNRVYRCHVCRLELVLDAGTNKLVVASLAPDADPKR